MKKYVIFGIVSFCLLIVCFVFLQKDKKSKETAIKESTSFCYYYTNKADRGFYDKFYIRLDINGENVTGEFNSYPAEKDSKVGTFEGTVEPLDQKTNKRTANLWWDSFAEGMNVKEELVIQFDDNGAMAAAGEMIDRGDGVYVYTDKSKLFYGGLTYGKISCENLDEINIVEKYVRDNIKTIATDKPVLGGSWYVISVFADYVLKQGTVTYEDGHIQSNAKFEYEFDNNTKNVIIKKFEI